MLLANQVNFVDDNESDVPDVSTVTPAPGDTVPLLGCGHNQVRPAEYADVRAQVTSQLHDSTGRKTMRLGIRCTAQFIPVTFPI